ncbi:hypothetical protein KKE19_02360 [Patescibacteria group bacterium]|nr:hypothetical protein [Patescibacteria group bacterium]MBU4367678.1 hypothetical protein [Patescibacteria group bacterium]MBU4461872.1 hypothetical protein [Patescibacteria group bacterium]MCG2699997.1 hypothetical protein [Candidatus Parcubacteria bacterium]
MIKTSKVIVAFLAGASGALFLLIFSSLVEIPIPKLDNLLVVIPYFIIAVGFVEEGIKFLLVSRWGKFPYYCIFLGLGYALFEMFVKDMPMVIIMGRLGDLLSFTFWFRRNLGFVMQIVLTITIAYFIKRNKPVFGLAVATLIHAGMDILLFI